MHLIKPLGAAAAALVLTACTTNPYTGEQQASKAATYGAGAAAVCGLVGAIDSGKHARNAALGCGIVGAGVGAYMDVQEAKLKEELQGTGVQVVREGDNIRLIMPGNITFETDSYNLRSSFYSVLNSVGQVLSKYADTTLRVSGHTDNTGSRQYNQTLSERRAGSVADYLATREVDRARMLVQGMGFDQPIADNGSAAGRAQNRRVELYILPNQR
ncbi:MAG: OmpA family protein [Halioglobus sp.]|jgi:outer membrane protein OmpA-like peptidoglycan-associated protein|nr:OmpA family protein [Halieaceae bacterium]MBT6125113.1 OmpA family protein [Halieaceae bacterium]MDG1387067.1 OmpA family protein [Halioglobus sp.]